MQQKSPQWAVERSIPIPAQITEIIGSLPEWFGLPEANQEYVDAARTKETWIVAKGARIVGAALLDHHFPHVTELYFMAVHRDHLGQGAGTALINTIEANALSRGVKLLEVKTLGASHPDEGYAKTRRFYEKVGFLPLEETDLWGDDNPCLIMIKSLSTPPSHTRHEAY